MNKQTQTMPLVHFELDSTTADLCKDFTKGKNPQGMAFVNAKDAKGKPVRFKFECSALAELIESEFGHSVLCKVENVADQETLLEIQDAALAFIPSGIEFKDFVVEEKIFLKLKTKDGKFRSSIDPPMNPTQMEFPISYGSQLEIEAGPGFWVNFETKKAGLYLTIHKLVIDGGKKKVRRR